MSAQPVEIKIHIPHCLNEDDPWDYHEWYYVKPIKCDRLGRPNPRMTFTNWQFWRCNNPECPGQAFVCNDVIERLIIEAEATS